MYHGSQTRKLLYFMRIGEVIAAILFVWAESELRTGTGVEDFHNGAGIAVAATMLTGNCLVLRFILTVNSVGSVIEACLLLGGTLLYPIRVLTCFAF
jgi:hypothetical protein